MKKENVTRESLKRNIMKKVVFDIEYNTTLDIKKYIEEKRDFFYKFFKEYSSGDEKEIKIEIGNQNKILENNVIGTVHSFRKFKNETNVQMTITKNNISFEINPENNYKKINDYIETIDEILKEMKSSDSFLNISKITLKKSSYEIYQNLEELFKDFEKSIICGSNDKYKRKLIREIETIEYKTFLIYYNRGIESGIVQKNGEQYEAFRGYLDITGILDKDKLEELREEIRDILYNLNDALFDIFKDSVTEDFLNRNLAESGE